ncbi:MAG: DUF4179 domain-containing protein [Clostridia bacterium]|nr:DUF4179 domain-containing protein [Clostridia bacterium]MBR1585983.1 DUF4179 domain-containing protein [Clostridia bacterium]
MTENREDERIKSAMNRMMSGLEGNPYLARRVVAASKGEVKVKKKFSIVTVLTIALMLISVTALALELSGWKIADYIRNVVEGKVDENFESGFNQDLTLDFEGVRFHVRDAYAAGNKIIIVTEVSCLENETTMILPSETICDPDVTLARQYIKELAGVDDEITLSDYAKQKGLSMIHVYVNAQQKGTYPIVSGDEWIENDTTLVSITSANYLEVENGEVEVEWEVGVFDDSSDDPLTTKTLDFRLPVENVQEIEIDVQQTVTAGDILVSLDRMVLLPTRLDTQVELYYHTGSRQSAEQLLEYRFIAIDPSSMSFLDEGSFSSGPEILDMETQSAYMRDFWTLGGPLETDKLYLQLLPVYSWAKEGVEMDQGLSDVQIIKINIPEKD